MNFKEKVQSMTAEEIIMAMVRSLTHPPLVNVNMSTYGSCEVSTEKFFFGLFKRKKKVCFGCAATNTICEISGKVFHGEEINHLETRAEFIGSDWRFLDKFEAAINALRCGGVSTYNSFARDGGFAIIENVTGDSLPELYSNYTNEDLIPYHKLAHAQKMLQYAE